MSEKINYIQIKTMIEVVYKGHQEEYPKNDKTLESAKKIYKKIKDFERIGEDGEVDYKQELNMAISDLFWIFDIEASELNTLTKNNIYMLHQSKLVNAIYMMNNNLERLK